MPFDILRPRPLVALAAAMFAAVFVRAWGDIPIQGATQLPAATLPADYFEAQVRPILAGTCYDCHTDDEKGGLRLDSRESMLRGGDTGPAVVPGDPESSLLIQAVRQLPGRPKMPKGKAPKLSEAQIAILEQWIRGG